MGFNTHGMTYKIFCSKRSCHRTTLDLNASARSVFNKNLALLPERNNTQHPNINRMRLDKLPEELIELVISFLLPEWHESIEIYELEILTSLSKVSRKFRRIVEPHLYRNIELYYGDLSEDPVLSEIGQKLSQVLRENPRYCSHVKNVKVEMVQPSYGVYSIDGKFDWVQNLLNQLPNLQSIHFHNFTDMIGIKYICFPFQFHESGNVFANLKELKLDLPTWNTGHILRLVELPQLETAIIYPAHIEGIPDVEFEKLRSVSPASKLKTLAFRDILSFSGNGTDGQLSNFLTLIGRCCPLLTNFTLGFRSTIAFFCHTREFHNTFTGQSWMRKLRELIFICTSKLRTVPNPSVEARTLLDDSEKEYKLESLYLTALHLFQKGNDLGLWVQELETWVPQSVRHLTLRHWEDRGDADPRYDELFIEMLEKLIDLSGHKFPNLKTIALEIEPEKWQNTISWLRSTAKKRSPELKLAVLDCEKNPGWMNYYHFNFKLKMLAEKKKVERLGRSA